ncbi:hypothetical protein [Paenibacillus macquariensis]|uniref:Uncharacterized protein n=1 Tax=Paenibacillus macquariensis TaxID=948756 RepID=A0ABY1KEN9_9BACL|nr:hypothetical protein [Paenibacillus macquariensis]OAB27858.1 hypothetical protein PMSM_24500 [Paenibacillus macquariensis subsp. macquariensis]SIR72409.1 hypothetical protein SAMN05421578_1475 [Paenibacillus macquariensis]
MTKILTCSELYELSTHPKINTISLELLREYYATYLEPFKYEISLTGNDDGGNEISRTIDLRFDKDCFCHLVATKKIVKRSVRSNDLYKYFGSNGYDNIQNGMINFDLFKTMNRKLYDLNKSKFVFFYLIPLVMDNAKAVLFDGTKLQNSDVDCDIIFYDEINKKYIHLGVDYNEKKGYYRPVTFLVEKVTEANSGLKFIENQNPLLVGQIHKVSAIGSVVGK